MAIDSAVLMSMRLHATNSRAIFEAACDAIQALAEQSGKETNNKIAKKKKKL